jgi:hypothetical protein
MNNNNIALPITNSKTLQKEDFIERMNEIISKRIKIPFAIVLIFTSLFYIMAFVFALLGIKTVSIWYVLIVSTCLIIALFVKYGLSTVLGQLRYNQYSLTRSGSNRAIVFYKDYLELKVGNEAITTLPFVTIRKTILTEHLYIISFPNMVSCAVRRDGFTENDFEIIQARINNEIKVGKSQN